MHALRFDSTLSVDRNVPTPEARAGESVIRVLRAGICSTDIELCKGYMGYSGILGHEFVGIVEQIDGGSELQGKRVVGEINASCHHCKTCRSGHPTHCPYRTVLGIQGRDGTFAEFVRLPSQNLYPLSDRLSNDHAVFIEPLAAACEIIQQVDVRPTDHIVVIGDGKLGLLCAQVLRLSGCSVTLLGHHEERNIWLERLGISMTSHTRDIPTDADIVVEATGTHEGFSLASDCVRPRGTLVLKSTYHGTLTMNMAKIVIDEISVVGSRCGPFAPAIRLLEQGLIQVQPMIHAHYPLLDGLAAFEHATTSGVLKVMLCMD